MPVYPRPLPGWRDKGLTAGERDRRTQSRSEHFAAGVEHRTMDLAGKHVSDFPVDSPSQSSARYQYGGWGYRKHASQPRY